MSDANETSSEGGVDWIAWGMLAIVMVSFGSTFVFNKIALTEFSALNLGAWRLIIAAIPIVMLAYAMGQPLPMTRKFWLWSAAYGVTRFAFPFFLLCWAQQFLPSNVVAIYYAAIPLLLLGMSVLFLGTRVTRKKLAGILVGTGGLIYLAGPGTIALVGAGSFAPQFAMLLSTLSLAFVGIIIRVMPKFHPMAMIAGGMAVGGILAIPIAVVSWPETMPGSVAISAMLGGALISTSLGQSLRFLLIRRKGPVFMIPNSYGSTIFAALLSWMVFAEPLAWQTLAAFALIVVAIFATEDGSGHMKSV